MAEAEVRGACGRSSALRSEAISPVLGDNAAHTAGGGVPVDPGEAMSKRGLSLVAVCVFAGSLPRAPKPMESQESGQGDQCVLI